MGSWTRRRRGDRGSMAVEVVILTPVLMMFVLLIVAFGRYVGVKGDIEATARDAARAASLEASAAAAEQAARSVVSSSLSGSTDCQSVWLGGTWAPGGEVEVTLDCSVSYAGLGLIGVPGSADLDATSAAPLDPYRRYE